MAEAGQDRDPEELDASLRAAYRQDATEAERINAEWEPADAEVED